MQMTNAVVGTMKDSNASSGWLPSMNRSTIYRRHERRLAKSLALRDDTRPALIRVMSLLPGFSLFVPPFQPELSMKQSSSPLASKLPVSQVKSNIGDIGEYSEDTVFETLSSSPSSTTTFAQPAPLRTYSGVSPLQSAAQASFSTAIVAGAANFTLGLTETAKDGKRTLGSSNPMGRHASATLSSQGVLAIQAMRQHQQVSSPLPKTSTRSMAMAASTTGFLFGSKEYFASFESEQSMHLGSSVSAGALGAAVTALVNQPIYATLSASRALFVRHALANSLYFASYEFVRSCQPQEYSQWNVAMAGGVAGCVQSSILMASRGVFSGVMPTLVRAFPTHALIFTGFESMRRQCQQHSSSSTKH